MFGECMISCKKATILMSKSFEEKLSLKERFALLLHLSMCKTCVYCFRQIKKLSHVFSHYDEAIFKAPPHSDLSLSEEAKQRIKSSLPNN